MLEYDFSNIKDWTEEQIKNGDYHDYSDTIIRKDGRKKERRVKVFGGAGGVKYSHWVWFQCYGYWPEKGLHIHHKDLNPLNDNVENLVLLEQGEHSKLHGEIWSKPYKERYGQEKAKRLKNLISEKTKEGMSKVKHPNLGKQLPETTRKKISQSLKGKMTGEKNHFYGEDHSGENNPFYGKKHTEETKRKISISNKGSKAWNKGQSLSKETKEKMSRAHADFSGERNPFAGKTHSAETKKKLAEINTKHQIWDVWVGDNGKLKYKDANGKNRRVPSKKIPIEIKKKVEAFK